MTEALRRAIELAQQQPEDEQDMIAQLILQQIRDNKERRIEALGWSQEEAGIVRERLLSFEEDWNAPGMDVYDEL
jgi:hypothetical protein